MMKMMKMMNSLMKMMNPLMKMIPWLHERHEMELGQSMDLPLVLWLCGGVMSSQGDGMEGGEGEVVEGQELA